MASLCSGGRTFLDSRKCENRNGVAASGPPGAGGHKGRLHLSVSEAEKQKNVKRKGIERRKIEKKISGFFCLPASPPPPAAEANYFRVVFYIFPFRIRVVPARNKLYVSIQRKIWRKANEEKGF